MMQSPDKSLLMGLRPMVRAIREGNIHAVIELLNQNVKPETSDFQVAVTLKHYPILELFLNDGYDINERVRADLPPPLADAVFDFELTKWLLEKGADPNARCHFDETPLSIATQRASFEVIQLLFEFGASVYVGEPLYYAVRNQRSNDIIEFLIEKGAPINENLYQRHRLSFYHFEGLPLGTPLHAAAETDNHRIFNLLMAKGADPNIRDNWGRLPEDLRPPPHKSRI